MLARLGGGKPDSPQTEAEQHSRNPVLDISNHVNISVPDLSLMRAVEVSI